MPTVAALSEEPAGRIITRTVGAVLVEATLTGRPRRGVFRGAPVPPVPFVVPAGVRHVACFRGPEETPDAEATDELGEALRFGLEVRALDAAVLGRAVHEALREISAHAALHETILECRAVRLAEPSAPRAAHVERLALDLLGAGVPVTFGPSWTPLAVRVDLAFGVHDMDGDDASAVSRDLAEAGSFRPVSGRPLSEARTADTR